MGSKRAGGLQGQAQRSTARHHISHVTCVPHHQQGALLPLAWCPGQTAWQSTNRMAPRAGDGVPMSTVPTVPSVSLPAKDTFPLLPSMGSMPAVAPSSAPALAWHWWSGKAKGRRPCQRTSCAFRTPENVASPFRLPCCWDRLQRAQRRCHPPTETPPTGMPRARHGRAPPHHPNLAAPRKTPELPAARAWGWMQSLAPGWHHPGRAAGTEPGERRHSCTGSGVWHSVDASSGEGARDEVRRMPSTEGLHPALPRGCRGWL